MPLMQALFLDLDRFNVENDLVQATGNEGEKKVTDEDVKELEE